LKVRRIFRPLGRALAQGDSSPDVFAVVMATGVVSMAAARHHYRWISLGLQVIAGAAFVLLGLGVAVRVLAHPATVYQWTRVPDVALRMFTFVAACTVLAARWSTSPPWQWLLTGLALGGWLILAALAGIDLHTRRPEQLRDHAHGAWLLPSVATQGLVISATGVGVRHHLAALVILAAAAWMLGLVIYVVVTGLLVWQALGRPVTPETITPDSWILMGSLAITALAASHLLGAARLLHAPPGTLIAASTAALGSWILACLWIPALLYAEMWRADHLTGSLRYQGAWWSAVFPIGMYSLASSHIASTVGIPALQTVSLIFFWNALVLWTLVATGLVHTGLARAPAAGRETSGATHCELG
jgi:tellurite resistance protein TehA-like permease